MLIFRSTEETTLYLQKQIHSHHTIGFVPTMGALHEGHLSLIHRSKKQDDLTVCSIFVNPLQFNRTEDFEKYPITIERDIALLEEAGCDVLLLPTTASMYPEGFEKKHYDLGQLDQIWEGQHRPGHFQGVCNVVRRLLEIVPCQHLFLGRKDYQQCMVINELIAQSKLNVQIIIEDTKRESSGLAMSSRNLRLSKEGLEKAALIYDCMMGIKYQINAGALNMILKQAIDKLQKAGFDVEYFALTDPLLNPLTAWNGTDSIVCIVAASIEGVRLIDNMLIH